MNVVIVTWNEYVPESRIDQECTYSTELGVFDEHDHEGIEQAKLAYATSRVAIDAEDVSYGPVWVEDAEGWTDATEGIEWQGEGPPPRQIPEEPDLNTFLSWYGDQGFYLVYGPVEVGKIYPDGMPATEDSAAKRRLINEEGYLIGTYPPVKPPQEGATA